MLNILALVDGKKTYIMIAVAALYVVINHFFGTTGQVVLPGVAVNPDTWISDLWQLALLATGRSALGKVV